MHNSIYNNGENTGFGINGNNGLLTNGAPSQSCQKNNSAVIDSIVNNSLVTYAGDKKYIQGNITPFYSYTDVLTLGCMPATNYKWLIMAAAIYNRNLSNAEMSYNMAAFNAKYNIY